MNCRKCNNLLFEYLDGALSDRQRAAMDTHLEHCESCRTKLEAEKSRMVELKKMLNETTAGISVNPFMSTRIKLAVYANSKKEPVMKISRIIEIAAVVVLLLSLCMIGGVATFNSAGRKSSVMKSKGFINRIACDEVSFESGYFAVHTNLYIEPEKFNMENYTRIYENSFLNTKENPLSTFSIDVDTASYANMRRFLNKTQLPPPDAIRIEELVNYFDYEYPQSNNEHPFSITLEGGKCPWNSTNSLVLIGLQGKEIDLKEAPPNNLVFLLDVSGSMDSPDKLPLLKRAFKLLTEQLRPQDRVAIVVYAGSSGLVLDSTAGNNKEKILEAIERLSAGGSTAGAAGITLAYKVAKENLISNGNNRVILATDGDFNVGVSSDGDLVRMIEEKRDDGIFLTVLGLGTGNYKDNKMEQLADKGNGNYSYLDSILEAKKVLVNELGGTLITIAKDVKLQIEFNPANVKAYRLIGYENRMLAKEDFNDDKKDAGELGAGHEVTAIYELVPPDAQQETAEVDELKYQQTSVVPSEELMTVKLRYKKPDGDTSILITESIDPKQVESKGMPRNLGFASSVAEFGMLLRDSQYKGTASFDDVIVRAKEYKGTDDHGYRAEFIQLVEKAQLLKK